jgi:hypothetical protein
MIPAVITDTSIMFFAKGRPWTLASDHPKFGDVKALLFSGADDVDLAIQLTDVRIAVDFATEGVAVLTEETLIFNGERSGSTRMSATIDDIQPQERVARLHCFGRVTTMFSIASHGQPNFFRATI